MEKKRPKSNNEAFIPDLHKLWIQMEDGKGNCEASTSMKISFLSSCLTWIENMEIPIKNPLQD